MNIALSGYGAMGKEIETAARQRGHAVIFRFTSASPMPSAFPSVTPDCVIDFSRASAVEAVVRSCASSRIPLVIGTTGWNDRAEEILAPARAAGIPLIYGSNFSVGAQVMFRLAAELARLLAPHPQYDAAIHEVHHTRKKDAPSGTALTIARAVLSASDRKHAIRTQIGSDPLQPEELLITSQRLGNVPGDHTLTFSSAEDELVLTHRAHSRSGFAVGAVIAAELLSGLTGIHRFDDIVFSHTSSQQS